MNRFFGAFVDELGKIAPLRKTGAEEKEKKKVEPWWGKRKTPYHTPARIGAATAGVGALGWGAADLARWLAERKGKPAPRWAGPVGRLGTLAQIGGLTLGIPLMTAHLLRARREEKEEREAAKK